MVNDNESKLTAKWTPYDGHRFRSRQEAKWAVFFKHMGIEYEYEDSDTSCGEKRTLVDFYLPDFEMWIEVKHDKFSDDDRSKHVNKYLLIPRVHGQMCVIAYGDPMCAMLNTKWNSSILLFRARTRKGCPTQPGIYGSRVWFSSDDEDISVMTDIDYDDYKLLTSRDGKWNAPKMSIHNVYGRDVEKVALYARDYKFEHVATPYPPHDSKRADEEIDFLWRTKHSPGIQYVGTSEAPSNFLGEKKHAYCNASKSNSWGMNVDYQPAPPMPQPQPGSPAPSWAQPLAWNDGCEPPVPF